VHHAPENFISVSHTKSTSTLEFQIQQLFLSLGNQNTGKVYTISDKNAS
jgi:hypothetical protein